MPTRDAKERTILGGMSRVAILGLALGQAGCGGTNSQPAADRSAARTADHPTEAGQSSVEGFYAQVRPDDAALTLAVPAAQAIEFIDGLNQVRAAFDRLDPVRKTKALAAASTYLQRIVIEPAPENWGEAMLPTAEMFSAALGDPAPAVRAGALEAIGGLWSWKPGAPITPDQERFIGQWKERLYQPVVRCLDDEQDGVRLAAVQCLGQLQVDSRSAPAVARLGDSNPAIRLQVLNSFAARRDLMTEEDILPRLYDSEPAVALAAQVVLRARGLDEEQLGLAKLMYHPRPELRVSAIEALQSREDIDPVVWLLQLSRDRDELVRSEALKALARRISPDAYRRVAEMAEGDPSEIVRQTASELLLKMTAEIPPPQLKPALGASRLSGQPRDLTADLVPLPGTVIPSPTAN
jgi:HEAT repeat protein